MSKREATVLLSRVFQGLFHTLELSSDSGSQLLPSCGAEACLSKEQRRDCWGLRAGESMESIYKVSRQIKQKEHSLYNALRSIYHDSLFVAEIAALWPRLPLLANLRCGLWYSQHFYDVCYFKSTDGHNGNWSFNVTRLNLHVAELAAQKGGCIIVDATRKGKRFPDSMSKTLPIWACVINRALADLRKSLDENPNHLKPEEDFLDSEENSLRRHSLDWDCQLHLPIWVSETEKNNIVNRLDTWVEDLKNCGANLIPLAQMLRKPLRTLWVSQKTVIWLNEIVDTETLDFTPIFLVSASQPVSCSQRMTDAEFSWSYIPGAADDEESWARGLTPSLFWKHVYELLDDGPADCNRKVAVLVERDRVYRALRGQVAPQVRMKSGRELSVPADCPPGASFASNLHLGKIIPLSDSFDLRNLDTNDLSDSRCSDNASHSRLEEREVPALMDVISQNMDSVSLNQTNGHPPDKVPGIHWIGSTGLAVGASTCCQVDSLRKVVDCVLDVSSTGWTSSSSCEDSDLHLPIVGSKFDRHSLESHLPEAIKFAREKLTNGLSIFICCQDGEDISVCVCLAILLSCFDSAGKFCNGSLDRRTISKAEVRQSLILLASFHSGARPSRGCLKQVYNYLKNLQ